MGLSLPHPFHEKIIKKRHNLNTDEDNDDDLKKVTSFVMDVI